MLGERPSLSSLRVFLTFSPSNRCSAETQDPDALKDKKKKKNALGRRGCRGLYRRQHQPIFWLLLLEPLYSLQTRSGLNLKSLPFSSSFNCFPFGAFSSESNLGAKTGNPPHFTNKPSFHSSNSPICRLGDEIFADGFLVWCFCPGSTLSTSCCSTRRFKISSVTNSLFYTTE